MPLNILNKIPPFLWRIKGTILVQVVIITIGFLTRGLSSSEHRRLLHRFGFDYELLRDAHVWSLLTGTWIQSTPDIAASMILLVFGGTFFLELLAGTKMMLLTCVTGDWVATLLTTVTIRVLAEAGDTSVAAMLSIPDAGSSALAHAGYGAAVMLLPLRWLKIALPCLIILTVMQFSYEDLAPAIVHCWAALYGVLVGWFIIRPRLERGRELRLEN